MRGFQLSFYTQLGRRHGLRSIAEWLLREAKKLEITGTTVRLAQSGFGNNGEYQPPCIFSLTGRPIEIIMAVSGKEAERLFMLMKENGLKVFYVKMPVEYGIIGKNNNKQNKYFS